MRQAVGRALCTLEQFTISEAKIFQYNTNTSRGTKTKLSYSMKKNINSVNNLSVIRDGNRIELQFLKTLNGTGQNINSKHHEMKRNQSNASHCKLLRLIISLH